jgi:hypothetical protein
MYGGVVEQGSCDFSIEDERAPGVDIYLRLDDAADFKAWQTADQAAKRRLN